MKWRLAVVIFILFAACSGEDSVEGNDETTPTSNNAVAAGPLIRFEINGSAQTDEAGAQAELSMRLNAAPTAPVTVSLEVSDESEASIAPQSLTFTPDNFNAPQLVLVTGLDDDIADGPQQYTVAVTQVEGDPQFDGESAEVELTNRDDDSAGAYTTLPDGQTREDGQQTTFDVALQSRPAADVVVEVVSSNPAEGTLSPARVVFTPDNWRAPKTIRATGVDDPADDGDQPFQAQFQFVSEDPDYDGLELAPVEITNIDDDTASISVRLASGEVNEDGGSATVELQLNSRPADSVTLSFALVPGDEAAADRTEVTFTPDAWQTPQPVVLTGRDDELVDGDQPFELQFEPISSPTTAYDGFQVAPFEVLNYDNDSAGFIVTPLTGDTTEAGGAAEFTIALRSQPIDNVEIAFSVDAPQEVSVSPSRSIFSTANWNRPKTVMVTGLDDDIADGNQPFTISFAAAISTDPNYNGLPVPPLTGRNLDDDSVGISLVANTTMLSEMGASADVEVVLASEPVADVTIQFASSDDTEASVAPEFLTFTAANWNVAQSLTVTGVDDGAADGPQSVDLMVATIMSTDAAYAALAVPPITFANDDDDSVGFAVSAISGDTSEDGTSATFDLRLTSRPTSNVRVTFATSDATEGTTTTNSANFSPGSWDLPQTITVVGQDDPDFDGDQPYQIVFQPATSNDPTYAGLVPPPVDVVNIDRDYEVLTNTIVSGAYEYASMDDYPFDGVYGATANTCQTAFLPIPHGWEIAPRTMEAVTTIVGMNPWATHCMVFSDGTDAKTTSFTGNCACAACLEVMGDTYRPGTCARRILIRRTM